MDELIKITERNGNQVVSAKELYDFLELAPQHYGRWCLKNIIKNEFAIENEDYIPLPLMGRYKDFALNIDFAKKISMMARTEKGETARNYFIACEKAIITIRPGSTLDILEMTIKNLRGQNMQLDEVKSEIKNLKTTVDEIQVFNAPVAHFSIMGYCRNIKKQIGIAEAKVFGTKARALCNELGYVIGKIPDPRFGTVNTYPLDVLNEVIKTNEY